ncbi:MAG TPA: SAM-dependent methyltransferase [Oxalicibacterium sp.]|nr:SAM-dependent methyltransferase [Oxalicibacterium sp.]
MYANSSSIVSAQTGPHEQLPALVMRHAEHAFQQPIAAHNRHAFDHSIARWRECGAAPLILDAGCGVGLSTMHLAALFPDHFVIGVDQSADRSTRNTQWEDVVPDNCLRVRANLVDYWRLLLESGVRPVRHYVLYPNPWPKIGHLSRRWHGHAVFPTVIALGGYLECRSNWRIYIEEFAAALTLLTRQAVACEAYEAERPITPFERKYRDSGHALWRCHMQLPTAVEPIRTR